MTGPTAPSWTPCGRSDEHGSAVRVPHPVFGWGLSRNHGVWAACLGEYFPGGSWRKGFKEVSLVLGPI